MGLKSLAQAAEELGLSPETLRHQASTGSLRAQKVGRNYIVDDAEIARYRAERLGRVGRPRKAK